MKSPLLTPSLSQKKENVQPPPARSYTSPSLLTYHQQTASRGLGALNKPSLTSTLISTAPKTSFTPSASIQTPEITTAPNQPSLISNISLTTQVAKPQIQLISSIATKVTATVSSAAKEKKRRDKDVSIGKKVKSKRVKKEAGGLASVKRKVDYGSIDNPTYNFDGKLPDVQEMEIPEFVPPEKDEFIIKLQRPVHDIEAMKVSRN